MSKRTVFTTITPLPPGLSRELAVSFLQDHLRMIDLNPLVIARHPISCPANAPPDEHHCAWYSLTDSISYLPGGKITGEVSYTAAFNNVSKGVQTHVYAPMGLNIRETWTVAGTLPGEPNEPVELGLGAPQSGLYVREDVDMRCNVLMSAFVKKTLKKAHSSLVEAIKVEAQRAGPATPSPSVKGVNANANANANPPGYPSHGTMAHTSGNPPAYDSVSPTSPAFSFTASPTTSRRLSMDDKDHGLLIDYELFTLPPLQTDVAPFRPFKPTRTTTTITSREFEYNDGGDGGDGDSPILSYLATKMPAYLSATSFTSSPTLNDDDDDNGSPTSGPHSAYPSPLRLSRRPTSASFYPSTPHEAATRPSPSARFSAWQPFKPLQAAGSVVSRYPRAKEQDYSDIAASNPFAVDDSPSWESPILGRAKSQRIKVEVLEVPTTRVTKEEETETPVMRRYPAMEPEKVVAVDLGALGILPAGRPRSALEVRQTKTYSAYIPSTPALPSKPALPSPPTEQQGQKPQFDGIGATLSGPPVTDWYY